MAKAITVEARHKPGVFDQRPRPPSLPCMQESKGSITCPLLASLSPFKGQGVQAIPLASSLRALAGLPAELRHLQAARGKSRACQFPVPLWVLSLPKNSHQVWIRPGF